MGNSTISNKNPWWKFWDKDKHRYYRESEKKVVRANYYEFLDLMYLEGWNVTPLTFTEDSYIIKKYPLNSNVYGCFLEIICPEGRVITCPGIKQTDIDAKHFSKYPNLYKYPYFLNLRCFNDKGDEPYWSTIIKIMRLIPSEQIHPVSLEYYDDLHIKADSRYKRLEERFYFKNGFFLDDKSILQFYMMPDVDITDIELFGKVDLFTK